MTESPLQHSPLEHAHQELGARLVPFAGWLMPLTYEGQLAEHQATRNKIGIFDVSHMGQILVSGPRAEAFLQSILPADVATLGVGESRYSFLLTEEGGVIDDLIFTRMKDGSFFLVVNASNAACDFECLDKAAHGLEGVSVLHVSSEWAMIAVQGPGAFAALNAVIPGTTPWEATRAFTLHEVTRSGASCIVSRTGYTGEHGAEVLCPPHQAEDIWKALLAEGATPCGLAARDSLRLEAGYSLHGNDLSTEISPVEAGLSWAISWEKTDVYTGRDALEGQRRDGAKRKRVALVSTTRKPMRKGEIVLSNGVEVGVVTSGGYSPALQRGIALALVERQSSPAYEVRSGKQDVPCETSKLPFVSIGLRPR